MTLQEIANFGEIIGAAGVIASLVFVGWQIKTNTKTDRMRMHEQVTHTLLSFLHAVTSDPDAFVAGLRSTDSNFADLSDGQKLFFFRDHARVIQAFRAGVPTTYSGCHGSGDLGRMERTYSNVLSPAGSAGLVESPKDSIRAKIS